MTEGEPRRVEICKFSIKRTPYKYLIRERKVIELRQEAVAKENPTVFELRRYFNQEYSSREEGECTYDVYIPPEKPKYYATHNEALREASKMMEQDLERYKSGKNGPILQVWEVLG